MESACVAGGARETGIETRMKRQFQVVVVLAVIGASVVATTAVAGGIKLGVGGQDVSIDLPDGAGLGDLCQQLLGQGASVGTLIEAGCAPPEEPGGTDPGGDTGGTIPDVTDPDGTDPGDTDGGTVPPGTDPDEEPGGGEGEEPGDGTAGEGGKAGGRGKGEVDSKKKDKDRDGMKDDREPMEPRPTRKPDGTPTNANPSVTVADFGPAPIGVPNFVIDSYVIPPFLLPIYQACGTEYGIPWEVLASINRIETAFGTNLNVSSAGALGWMQFIPSSWRAYGVDANNDGRKDPYNPVDAICAAGNYLKAAGGQEDLSRAIFAYNHADWYVDEVLLYARQYGRIPDDLVGSLTGLTEGARFPVAADARYADDISERQAAKRAKPKKGVAGNAADVVSTSPTRRGINIYSREGAPVVAVNDGVVKKIGRSKKLGRYLILEDAYGNRFTYAQLGSVAEVYPVPKPKRLSADDFRLVSPDPDAAPERAASAGSNEDVAEEDAEADAGPENTEDSRERLYAFPERKANLGRADLTGQLDELLARRFPGYEGFKAAFSGILRFDRKTMEMEALHEGSQVVAGTVLGRIAKTDRLAPHLHFAIKPTGRGAPKIDPKPILDGWKLLEATAIYRAAGRNPFAGSGASVGQILLMSKEQLIRRTLNDPRLELYSCGREDIQTGQIDRRVMALLEYLTERGYRLTVTSLKCGHSFYTASGSVSHHSSGNAVDIAQINGLPVLGNQGPGSITEALVKDVLALQGTMTPDQVISLMSFGGPSFAMSDHADHVHVGFQPQYGPGSSDERQFLEILKPDQWERLIDRIADIDNPDVPIAPSRYSIPTKKGKKSGKPGRASGAHVGE
jgi:murein DD-endopeptidase MepM/ murein hydrolase activator NlpD